MKKIVLVAFMLVVGSSVRCANQKQRGFIQLIADKFQDNTIELPSEEQINELLDTNSIFDQHSAIFGFTTDFTCDLKKALIEKITGEESDKEYKAKIAIKHFTAKLQ